MLNKLSYSCCHKVNVYTDQSAGRLTWTSNIEIYSYTYILSTFIKCNVWNIVYLTSIREGACVKPTRVSIRHWLIWWVHIDFRISSSMIYKQHKCRCCIHCRTNHCAQVDFSVSVKPTRDFNVTWPTTGPHTRLWVPRNPLMQEV